MTVHRADVVVPWAHRAIADGAVAVADDRIVAVGEFDDVMRQVPDAAVVRWSGVLVAGFVNAHIHLQYTGFAHLGRQHYPTFLDWSDAFVDEYNRWTQAETDQAPADVEGRSDAVGDVVDVAEIGGHTIPIGDWAAAARVGAELGLAHGTTAFADVVTDIVARDVLADTGVAGIAYLEVLGLDLPRWTPAQQVLHQGIVAARQAPAFEIGVSPHTPYSVDEPVLRSAAQMARGLGLRLHVHLAEVDGEQEFYRTGSGPLAQRIAQLVPPTWSLLASGGTGLGAGAFADRCELLGADSHVAHGVHLDAEDRRLLRERRTVVALCPRSNEVVGTGQPPVAALLAEGNLIAVGTDSLSSSPSLDVLADVARLWALAVDQGYARDDLAVRLLDAANRGGAVALGMSDEIGTLEPGSRADFAVIDVDASPAHAPEALVREGAGRCTGVVAGGVIRSGAPR